LQQRQGVTAREIARRGKVIADALRKPQFAFTHRAVCGWLNGTRNPSLEHRRVLAVILGVSLDELNHGCDGPFDAQKAVATLKPVTVDVFGKEQHFEYRMTISSEIELDRPAVYQHWADMFSPWPASLVRHFGRIKHDLYGWIPSFGDRATLHEGSVMVPLDARRPKLETEGTLDPHTWFVYLPGGKLEVGKAVQEGRWLVLAKRSVKGADVDRYPLSRVDLVGRVTGRALFEIRSPDQRLTKTRHPD
jgi:transcriptional regulator with XRE-family HTH domain